MYAMLEPVHPGSPVLAEEQSRPPRHLATQELADACLLIARCPDDGQRLDVFRLWPQRGVLETVEVSKVIATGDTSATATEWVTIAVDQHLLCIGFSNGGVSFFTPRGAVCHSFLFVPKPVRRIRLHGSPGDSRLVLLHEGGSLVVIDADSLRSTIYGLSTDGSGEGLRFQSYELKGREDTVDVCLIDSVHPFDDVFATGNTAAVVALGTRPFLSLHRMLNTGDSKGSLIGAAASALTLYAKSWMPFRGRGGGSTNTISASSFASAGTMRAKEIHMPPRGKVEDLHVNAKFIDQARVGEHLVLAPPRRLATSLAASCDAFGRVGLFCLETFRCFHIWKGYRDAQVAWMHEVRVSRAEEATQKIRCAGDDDAAMGLVIYAPRRGLLELWDVLEVPTPRRVDAVAVDLNCHLLASCGRVHLLRRNGRLDRIRWRRGGSAPPTDAGTLDASANSEPDSDAFDSAGSEGEGGGLSLPDANLCRTGVGPGISASPEEELMKEEFDAFANLRALARKWTEEASTVQHVREEDNAFSCLAFWRDKSIFTSLKQLRSPKLIEQALALLLSAHLRHNEELVRAIQQRRSSGQRNAHEEDCLDEILMPSETLVSALDWALEELADALQSEPQASLVRDRLIGESRGLRLYTELLRAALFPLPPHGGQAANCGVWAASPLGKALVAQQSHLAACKPREQARLTSSAEGDDLLSFQVWLAQQVESLHGDAVTRGLAVKAHQLLCTYAPPGCDVLVEDAQALSWTLLPYREFVAFPQPPPALSRFVCQALLISPQGRRQVTLAAELLQWRPLADSEQGYNQLPPIDAYGLDTIVGRSGDDPDDEFSEACAESVLQWLCTVPLQVLLQTPAEPLEGNGIRFFGAELMHCLHCLFSQQPQVLLGAICFAPAPVLPKLCWMCHALLAHDANGASQLAVSLSAPVSPCVAWQLFSVQLKAWLRLACATTGSPTVSVHRLLFAWPAVVAIHCLETAGQQAAGVLHEEHTRLCQEESGLEADEEARGIGCHPISASRQILGTRRPWLTAVSLLDERSGSANSHSFLGTGNGQGGGDGGGGGGQSCPNPGEFHPPPRGAAAMAIGQQQPQRPPVPFPWAVAANCALFFLWRHLHAPQGEATLQACMSWIGVLPSSLTQGALALLVFRYVFLSRSIAWLASAAKAPDEVDQRDLDRAIELLRIALAPSADLHGRSNLGSLDAKEQAPPDATAAPSSGPTLGPASSCDWSGDLGLRALASVGQRLDRLRQTLTEVSLLLRMMKVATEAGVAGDLHALFPVAVGWLAQEAQAQSFSTGDELLASAGGADAGHRERELRLELLLRLGTTEHLPAALALAKDLSLEEDLHAVLLRHCLLRGRDEQIDAHVDRLRGNGVVVDLVLEAMWHRIGAVLQLLCNDEQAQHAMVLCAVSPEVLARFVELDVDESTAEFVSKDVAFALRSCSALASHPLLQEESPNFHEAAHLSVSLLRALSGNP